MDLANPLIMGQMAETTNVLPNVQRAILGSQQIDQNNLLLAQAGREDRSRAAQAQLVSNPQMDAAQRELLYQAIAEANPAQAAAMRAQAIQQADLKALISAPNPKAIGEFMLKYPDAAKGVEDAWKMMSKGEAESAFRAATDVFGLLRSGDNAAAKKSLQAYIDAQKADGGDTSDYEHLLDVIDTDPAQATVLSGMIVASRSGPDKFVETFKALNPVEATTQRQREYEWRVKQFGKEAADQWLAVDSDKFVPVDGVGVFKGSDLIGARPGGSSPAPSSGGFTMPVQGGTFGQGVGASRDGGSRRHNGLDIAAPAGSPVSPVKPGRVVGVGSDPKSGKFVKVQHPDGSYSSYSHLAAQNVQVGDEVGPGQTLGTVGRTGNATGDVLHLVIRDANGQTVDPRTVLGGSGPVRVRSIQEAQRLAPGTRYIRPDGVEMTR